MIAVIISSAILFLSTVGLLYFAVKKIPVLLTYPAYEEGSSPKEIAKKIIAKMQGSKALNQVASPDVLLQNVLSKTRIVALKTESKTGEVLEKLRKKSQEKNGNPKFSDDYWKKLRKKKV